MASALKEGLSDRLTAEALDQFHGLLKQALEKTGVPAGLQLTFACTPAGVAIGAGGRDGTAAARMVDPDVCPALFDLYYGSHPVSWSIREGMTDGFARLSTAQEQAATNGFAALV